VIGIFKAQPIMTEERSREGRFIELAEKRVQKALGAIQSVANLSDRKNYSYTEKQVEQLVTALEDAIEDLKADFTRNKRHAKPTFEFKKD
jgi:hypothetical protein